MSVCKTCGKAMLTEWPHDHRKDRPDVAALAAALHDDPNIGALTRRFGSFNDVWWERSAETIIAALAALGWRITSAPEDSDEASSPASGEAKSEVVTADDPVSAQAAPVAPQVWYDTRGVATGGNVLPVSAQAAPAYIECPCCGKLWTAALAPNFQRATDAIVRVALEGLRAEVEAEYRKPNTWYGRKYGYTDVLRFIDARLAALDD